MEVPTNSPVSNQVQGLDSTSRVSEVKREREGSPQQDTNQTEENPDYRISLSQESRQAVAELTSAPAADPSQTTAALSEEEAVQLAQQASEQLIQTNASISNQAIQKAVDLFT